MSRTLTVGAHPRIEFKRDGDANDLDVELLRSEYTTLRERLQLQRGSKVYLWPRKMTRRLRAALRSPPSLPSPEGRFASL